MCPVTSLCRLLSVSTIITSAEVDGKLPRCTTVDPFHISFPLLSQSLAYNTAYTNGKQLYGIYLSLNMINRGLMLGMLKSVP